MSPNPKAARGGPKSRASAGRRSDADVGTPSSSREHGAPASSSVSEKPRMVISERARLSRGKRRPQAASQSKAPGAAGAVAGATKSKFENMLSGVDDYISRWRLGLDDLSSASRSTGESRTANSVWQSKEKSKVYSGKGDAIKALLLRNRKAFLKPPDERTSDEVEEVHNLISQTLQTEFFSKYNKSIQKNMAAAMKMEHFKANEVVFVQGDQPGNSGKYYIIAYGRVRIQVEQMAQLDESAGEAASASASQQQQQEGKPRPETSGGGRDHAGETAAEDKATEGKGDDGAHGNEGEDDPSKRPETSQGGSGSQEQESGSGQQDGHHHHHHRSRTNNQGGSPTGISISKITTRRQRRKSMIIASGSQLLTELETGQGFGELALLSDRARAASAVCAEETVLLTLDKGSYLSLMKNEHQKTQEVNLGALGTLRLFKDCTRKHIESIAPYFVIQTHNRGTMFNPDKDDHVSFIMKGHAVVAYGVQRQTKQQSKDASSLLSHHHHHVGGSEPGVGVKAVHGSPSSGVDKLTGLPLPGHKAGGVGAKSHSGVVGKPGGKAVSDRKREHNLFVIRDLHEGDVFGETCVFQQFQRGYQVRHDPATHTRAHTLGISFVSMMADPFFFFVQTIKIHAVTELEVLHISKVQFIDHVDEEVINHLREETAFRTSYYDGFYALAQKRIERRAEQLPELRDYLKDRAILYNSVISKSRSVQDEYSSRKNFPLMVDKNGRRLHYSVRSYVIKT